MKINSVVYTKGPCMKQRNLRLIVLTVSSLAIALAFSSCSKFEGDQTIPAYIRIDSLSLTTNYETQGAPTQNITDAWVYINNEPIGAYELPAVFPVLANGITEVRIDPGIKLNGIAALRTPYPFYKSIIQEVFLVEGEEVNLNSDALVLENETIPYSTTTTYYPNLTFVWMEDFEDPSLSLDSTSKSRTDISRTYPANNPEAFITSYSKYSGLLELTAEKYLIDVATNVNNSTGFILPKVGEYIFLEVDYKNDNYFTAGFYAREISQIIQHPVLNMNPRSEWNKIYINLTPGVSSSVNAIDFNIFFGATIEAGIDPATIMIDNVKLIHRKQ